jgi:hypothetical protein
VATKYKAMTEADIEQMVETKFNERFKAAYKASGANPGTAPTGPNGLFNTPGLDPNITTTYIPPVGVEGYLESAGHVRTSQYTNPVFGIITGQSASTGSEPTAPCDENVPVAGSLRLCQQVWPFGEMTMKSQVIRMDNQGELINSGSPVGLSLINNPFNTEQASQLSQQTPESMFRSTVAKLTTELANDFKRRYAGMVWTGNPTNTTGSSGGYIEFNGLNKIINTGYQDAISGTSCNAADSLVLNYGNAIVQNNAVTIVRNFVEATRDRRLLAEQIQFGPVVHAWVMRRQLFLALTEVWPCAYYTYRCYAASPLNNATAFVDTNTQVAMRDAMRAGQYLLIDGTQVPVIIDNTMEELNVGAGNFQSSAYLMPLAAPGSFGDTNGMLSYMEYFDYRGPFGMQSSLGTMAPDQIYKVSGDGRFVMMLLSPQSFCRQILMRTRKRLIMRTPFLAARIDSIRYNVYIHERDPQPNTSFWYDGGNSSFAGQSFLNNN